MVTPSYMLTLLDEFERQGIDPRGTSLRVGIFGAEPWTEQMRREIEERFAIDAVDIYGLSEVIGPGVAQECVETKDGLHIWEDHFFPEVVDPITGEVLPDGEKGELVFTSLTKEAMPVIRYRTRDLTRLLPGTARRLPADGEDHRPQRRHGDPARGEPLPHPDRGDRPAHPGRRTPLPAPAHPRGPAGRPHRTGRGPPRRHPRTREAAARAIAAAVKDGIGVSVAVEIVEPESLERSVGKIRRIVDARPSPRHESPAACRPEHP